MGGAVFRGALLLILLPALLRAQDKAPTGLGMALDAEAPDSAYSFVRMPPGWHVTMGPGAVLYDSLHRADGRFSIESEIFLFPNSSAEEYGLVLAMEAGMWTGLLLRRDGTAAVVRRSGAADAPLLPWASHDSVPKPGEAPARAILRVDAERDSTHFAVNGARIGSLLRSAAPVDGVFGLRIGRGVNVHVSRLDLTRRLAPPRGE